MTSLQPNTTWRVNIFSNVQIFNLLAATYLLCWYHINSNSQLLSEAKHSRPNRWVTTTESTGPQWGWGKELKKIIYIIYYLYIFFFFYFAGVPFLAWRAHGIQYPWSCFWDIKFDETKRQPQRTWWYAYCGSCEAYCQQCPYWRLCICKCAYNCMTCWTNEYHLTY